MDAPMGTPVHVTLHPTNGILELRLDDKGIGSSSSSAPSTSRSIVYSTTLDIGTKAATTTTSSFSSSSAITGAGQGNNKDDYIAFKVKVTAQQRYAVRPSTGWIKCGETCTVRITTTDNTVTNESIRNDKFLVECKCIRAEDISTFCSSFSHGSVPSLTVIDPTSLWSFTKVLTIPKLKVYSIQLLNNPISTISTITTGTKAMTNTAAISTTSTVSSPIIHEKGDTVVTPHKTIPTTTSTNNNNLTPPISSPIPLMPITGTSPSSSTSSSSHTTTTTLTTTTTYPSPSSILPKAPARVPNGENLKWGRGPLIGKGAFGIVHMGILTDNTSSSNYRGTMTDGSINGRPVAIKEIPLTMPSAWASACREAVALTICGHHPNVPKLYGLCRMKPSINSPLERAALIMEYVPGGTLAQLASAWANGDQTLLKSPYAKQSSLMVPSSSSKLHQKKNTMIAKGLPENAVQAYIKELLQGVIAVHQQGIAHRDIKGANLLLSSDGHVLLGDFGSCKLMPGIIETALKGSGFTTDNLSLVGDKGLLASTGNVNGSEWDEVLGTSRNNNEQPRSAREQGTLQWMAPEVVTTGLKLTRITHPATQQTDHNNSSPSSTVSNHRQRTVATVDTVQWWQQADIWSIGCTVLELLTARPPWFGIANDSAEVQIHIASTDLRDRLPTWLSPNAKNFIMACLHPDGNYRPTAEELMKYPFITSPAKDKDGEQNSVADEDEDDQEEMDNHTILDDAEEKGEVSSNPLYPMETLPKGKLVPIESLKNGCSTLERMLPLVRLGCRQASNWAQKHPHRGKGPTVDWLNNCTCADEVLSTDGNMLQYQEQQLQLIAAYYSEGFDDDLVGYIAEDVGLVSSSSLPHLTCYVGFIFNNWVPSANDNGYDVENADIRYTAMYSELELQYFLAASNTCSRLTESILAPASLSSPKSNKINQNLLINIEQLEQRLLYSVYSRIYYWVNRSTFSSTHRNIIENTAGTEDAKMLLDDSMKPTLWNVAMLKAWYIAAKLRLSSQMYTSQYVSPQHTQTFDEQEDESWYADTPNMNFENISFFDNPDIQPLWDAGYSTYHLAELHCWVFELKCCMKILYNIRRSREQRCGFGITSNISVSLPDFYVLVERKVYSTFLWLRRSWINSASSVGLSSESIDSSKSSRKSHSSRKYRNIISAREFKTISGPLSFSPSPSHRRDGKENDDDNNDTESSLETDIDIHDESKNI